MYLSMSLEAQKMTERDKNEGVRGFARSFP